MIKEVSVVTMQNLKKDKMLQAFIDIGYIYDKSISYCSYTFRRVKKEIRLFKGSKKIAVWDIENDSIEVSNGLLPNEKRIANKFCNLSKLAEQYYEIEMKNKKHPPQKNTKIDNIKYEIKQILRDIKDSEFTKERLTDLIKQLGDRYVYDFHGNCSADHFNDNYISYIYQTQADVERIMMDLGDNRVIKLLIKPNDKIYWNRYRDEELLKMVKVIPLSAQREGNLITITKEEHIAFEKLCERAYIYARKYLLNKPLRYLVPELLLQVCWWEKDNVSNKFWIPTSDLKPIPNTYREVVLEKLLPKPKKSPKPSKLNIKVYFDENDKDGNVTPMIKKSINQLGVITWKCKMK